jgi:hypothetical protein
MKSLLGTLRIAALSLLVALLFAGGESQSADRFTAMNRVIVTPAGSIAPTAQQATGGALVLGAYGFLLMLRRRTRR